MNTRCAACRAKTSVLPSEVRAFAEQKISEKRARSFLIPTLHKLQNTEGYLRDDHIEEVAGLFEITPNEVRGVASFYHFFTFKPGGKHPISVCTGTACHVRGAAEVLTAIKNELAIEEGEATEDGRFSIGSARCVGMCALAPVVMVGDKVYGNVTAANVEEILAEYGHEKKRKKRKR